MPSPKCEKFAELHENSPFTCVAIVHRLSAVSKSAKPAYFSSPFSAPHSRRRFDACASPLTPLSAPSLFGKKEYFEGRRRSWSRWRTPARHPRRHPMRNLAFLTFNVDDTPPLSRHVCSLAVFAFLFLLESSLSQDKPTPALLGAEINRPASQVQSAPTASRTGEPENHPAHAALVIHRRFRRIPPPSAAGIRVQPSNLAMFPPSVRSTKPPIGFPAPADLSVESFQLFEEGRPTKKFDKFEPRLFSALDLAS